MNENVGENGSEFWVEKLCAVVEDYPCNSYEIMRVLDTCINFINCIKNEFKKQPQGVEWRAELWKRMKVTISSKYFPKKHMDKV